MSATAVQPDLLTVPEVASILRVSRAQIWRMIWSGSLPAIKLSDRAVRVSRATLDQWLADRPPAGGRAAA